jgi:hypothetical protein
MLTVDSKSVVGNNVLVQVRPGAPTYAAQQRRLPSEARQGEGGLSTGSRNFGWQASLLISGYKPP